MAHQARRQTGKRVRPIFLIGKPHGQHHATRTNAIAVSKGETETPAHALDASDPLSNHLADCVVLKPGAIAQQFLARNRVAKLDSVAPRILAQRKSTRRVGQVCRAQGRAHVHALRHVLPPEPHGLAENLCVNAGSLEVRGDGKSVRTGADDSDFAIGTALSSNHVSPRGTSRTKADAGARRFVCANYLRPMVAETVRQK